MIRVLSAEELKIESSSIIIEYNYFEECIFVEKSSEISSSETKINLIIKFSRSINIFSHSISEMFFMITK